MTITRSAEDDLKSKCFALPQYPCNSCFPIGINQTVSVEKGEQAFVLTNNILLAVDFQVAL